MVDTVRTKDQLLTTIFQDGQGVGSITPQDIRDLIISLIPSSGAGRFTSPAVVNFSSIGVFTSPSSGTSVLVTSTDDIDMPQHGRIRYIGTQNRVFTLTLTLTAEVVGNNQDLRFQLTKNGIAIPETIVGRTWSTGPDEGSISMTTGIILSQNDYIELQVANDTSTNAVTISNGSITLHGHIL